MRVSRPSQLVLGSALAASLAACAYYPTVPVSVPVGTYSNAPGVYPSGSPAVAVAPAGVDYGRVTNIQYLQGTAVAPGQNVPGAILGGVAGAAAGNVLGSAVGGSNARGIGTVLGGAAGMALGSQAGRTVATGAPAYRVTVQTDQGVMRYFDVPSPGDLHVGDRVRVDNGVIYHY
ncbi:MAG TPA: glycine zipper 2TM domain-containing protein [Ramlibacter sp.]|nr:glycine zipper 2TM domain-containing protein [Ramlibacter sp.]